MFEHFLQFRYTKSMECAPTVDPTEGLVQLMSRETSQCVSFYPSCRRPRSSRPSENRLCHLNTRNLLTLFSPSPSVASYTFLSVFFIFQKSVQNFIFLRISMSSFVDILTFMSVQLALFQCCLLETPTPK